MIEQLHKKYDTSLTCIQSLVLSEIEEWNWSSIPQMKELVVGSFIRKGKRLRPLTAFLFCDVFNGDVSRVCHAACAIEIYHTATLIYDDIQDNSEFRRGLPCAHITTSTSMAMNQAGVVRSLMYHVIHKCARIQLSEKMKYTN